VVFERKIETLSPSPQDQTAKENQLNDPPLITARQSTRISSTDESSRFASTWEFAVHRFAVAGLSSCAGRSQPGSFQPHSAGCSLAHEV